MRGRPPSFCSRSCRSAARRAQQKTQTQISKDYDQRVIQASTHVLQQIHKVRRTAKDWRPDRDGSAAVLEQIAALRKEVDVLTGAAVQQARGRGVPWRKIAEITGIGANRAPQEWAPDRVDRMIVRRDDARKAAQVRASRERRALGQPRTGHSAEEPPDAQRKPEEQLRMALSYLHRGSGLSIRALARELDLSPSYLARLLTGERMAAWEVISDIVEACGGNPAEVRPLWDEVHHRLPSPPVFQQDGAVALATADLKHAIRGLYLAGACPDPDRLADQSPHLTGEQVRRLVRPGAESNGVPEWPVVERVVSALYGRPETILPLWQRVQVAQAPHWLPASRPTP